MKSIANVYCDADPSKVMTIEISTTYCIERIKELMKSDRNVNYIKEHFNAGNLYATLYNPVRTGHSYDIIDLSERIGTITDIALERGFIKLSHVKYPICEISEDELIAIPRALYAIDKDTSVINSMIFITFDIISKAAYNQISYPTDLFFEEKADLLTPAVPKSKYISAEEIERRIYHYLERIYNYETDISIRQQLLSQICYFKRDDNAGI